MRMMPVGEVITLLSTMDKNALISEQNMDNLFQRYGDYYHKEYGIDEWELCGINEKRIALLKEINHATL